MRSLLALLALCPSFVVGCVPVSRRGSEVDEHRDGQVVWVEKGIAHEDVVIDFGYRNEVADGVRWIEPVAVITRDGKPVANAMVFNSLASAGGGSVTEEVATRYTPSPDSDTAWYAQGKLLLSDDTAECAVRFRIVLPSSQQAWTREITLPAK